MVKPKSDNIATAGDEQVDLRERAVVVAVIRDGQSVEQTEEFLGELEFLAETADIVTVRRFTLAKEAGGAPTEAAEALYRDGILSTEGEPI